MKFGIRRLRTSYTALMLAQSSAAEGNTSSVASFCMKASLSIACVRLVDGAVCCS
jgi:hypothetical protein